MKPLKLTEIVYMDDSDNHPIASPFRMPENNEQQVTAPPEPARNPNLNAIPVGKMITTSLQVFSIWHS